MLSEYKCNMGLIPRIILIITTLFFLIDILSAQEKDLQNVLQFEAIPTTKSLPGWGGGPAETIHYDSSVFYSGKGAARLERDKNSPNEFSSITKKLAIDFVGEFIELKGLLRMESVTEFAGLWMREDGPSGVLKFDNMQEKKLKGTSEWTEYAIKLPLDKKARSLFFGVLVVGEGKVWADDLQLLVDGKPINQAPKRIIEPSVLDTDQQYSSSSGIIDSSISKQQIMYLNIMGRVWGFLKYHHPRIAAGELHWDFELFRILPDILKASNLADFQHILTQWVTKIGEVESCISCAKSPENVHILTQADWIHDTELLGIKLSNQLQNIYKNRFSGDEQFYVSLTPNVGNPVFDNELTYNNLQPPDTGYRILTLFRLWNIIEYWFPYRDQLDYDWRSVLAEFLPRFVQANSWDTYRLELLAFIARIGDTHANLWQERDVLPPRGNCYWPVEFRFIQGKATVVALTDSTYLSSNGMQVGDIIKRINNRSIGSLIQEWSPYYCASNHSTRLRDIARYLPRGNCTESELLIERDGQNHKIIVNRVLNSTAGPRPHDRPGKTFQLLSDDVAYIKLSSFRISDVDYYIKQASGTKGLVIDIRNYPSEFAVFALGQILIDKPTPFARFTVADLNNPGTFTWTEPMMLRPSTTGYKGKIAILVDEMSISQSEYTAMAFRSADRAVVVGSTTAGADGNVSRIMLPGGLQTMISGIGVFYPDKSPTQRVGIIPDIRANPTIKGIKEGRDEILEAALLHILGTDVDRKMIQKMAKPFPKK